MIEGEHTHQGIRIICGYIDGDFLNNDIKAKYAYEVARYYFDVMKEYSTAKHYFELTDSDAYPETVSYIERCEKMKHFDIEEEVK